MRRLFGRYFRGGRPRTPIHPSQGMATILEKMGHLKIWPTTYSKWRLRTSLAFNNLALVHQRLRFLFMAAISKRINSGPPHETEIYVR